MVIGGGLLPNLSPDHCPTCDRRLEHMTDYPLVRVVSLDDIVTVDKVPQSLPHGDHTELDERARWFSNRPVVPPEVLHEFNSALVVGQLAHDDGYVYHPTTRPDGRRRRWWRQRNYAGHVREMLEDGKPVQTYIRSLQERIGQDVSPKDLFPSWPSPNGYSEDARFFVIPQPGDSPLRILHFKVGYHRSGGLVVNTASIGLASRITREGDMDLVIPFALLRYTGKLREPSPAPSVRDAAA